MRDVTQIGLLNGGTLALVTFSSLKDALSCILLLVTIGFTVWKWRTAKRHDDEKFGD